ncbi:hypothetical protein Taro_043740 [Colocasia esculenta]|uniref:Uncharacterized protein n=1 Tax=Colocasia esculenta TaxID=4460 RepID=A0A843WH85_COLES|nr:hypothetical protein [Colocasia esculenta]
MPIDAPTWRAMSATHKDDVWEYVQISPASSQRVGKEDGMEEREAEMSVDAGELLEDLHGNDKLGAVAAAEQVAEGVLHALGGQAGLEDLQGHAAARGPNLWAVGALCYRSSPRATALRVFDQVLCCRCHQSPQLSTQEGDGELVRLVFQAVYTPLSPLASSYSTLWQCRVD